jgi:RNA polymerase sigma factor (sigma-70 family)
VLEGDPGSVDCERGQAVIATAHHSRRLTDEQAQLAGEHWDKAMRLARIHAAKYPKISLDWETAAAFGLCDAALRFDPAKDVKFWSFASPRVKFAFIDMMRQERLKGYRGRTEDDNSPAIENVDGLDGMATSGEEAIGWEIESIDAIDSMIVGLSKTRQRVLRLIYAYGLDTSQAARRLGVDKSYICRLHTQAIEHLRQSASVAGIVRRAS